MVEVMAVQGACDLFCSLYVFLACIFNEPWL